MNLLGKKYEIAAIGLVIFMGWGLASLVKAPARSALTSPDFVFQMPRPKTSFLADFFDLSNREIARSYVNPFAKKKQEAEKAVDPKKTVTPAKTVEQKKEAPKNQVAGPQKKFEITVIENNEQKGGGEDFDLNPTKSKPQQYSESRKNVPGDSLANGQDGKLSDSQWRALISAQPTKENVSKLVAAYNNKQIEEDVFFGIVIELYQSNKSETQMLGILAVKNIFNAKSFAITAHFYEQLDPNVQGTAHTYLLSYGVNSRLPYLVSALQSKDEPVVTTATQVVIASYKNAKQGVGAYIADPRSSRGDGVLNTPSSYGKFLGIFQGLVHSSDSGIAELAQTALVEFQSPIASL